ncbi:PAS domain-containing protein, partial [Frankia sp. AgW1.1]|nr:PAS domain-containing protein [Frankia sp. AgW1.1]
MAEVVFRTDAEGRWTYLNPAWTRLTGFDIDASLGNRFIDYVHPEELEHTIALFMAVVVGRAGPSPPPPPHPPPPRDPPGPQRAHGGRP